MSTQKENINLKIMTNLFNKLPEERQSDLITIAQTLLKCDKEEEAISKKRRADITLTKESN